MKAKTGISEVQVLDVSHSCRANARQCCCGYWGSHGRRGQGSFELHDSENIRKLLNKIDPNLELKRFIRVKKGNP